MPKLIATIADSLKKIEWNSPAPKGLDCPLTMFSNERLSFQISYLYDGNLTMEPCWLSLSVKSALAPYVTVREVDMVPCTFPCYSEHDDHYLFTEPRLVPDILQPLRYHELPVIPGRRSTLWFMVCGNDLPAGKHTVEIELSCAEETETVTVDIEVYPQALPEQRLLFTQWLHHDCIAHTHHVAMFSEEYWHLLRQYVQMAADYGVNTILTPLVTPPLDIAEGLERMTCQLVDIYCDNGRYTYGFERLERFIDLCLECGITHFEMGHLFTQWGAKAAPKVMAVIDGREQRIFGWETQADGEEYRAFLRNFLPKLDQFLHQKNIADRCLFHASDEPSVTDMGPYCSAVAELKALLPNYPLMDALSSLEVAKRSEVIYPVVAIDHIQPFLDQGITPLWGYYCCGQYKDVSNRFMAMPSCRNRILGIQSYKFNLMGFLHWGYNFYNCRLSRYPIDPYHVTDADRAFPSGDAFSVYPTEDGCIESLRLVVFHEGLQDYRALTLLEQLIGRAQTLQWLETQLPGITFSEYPCDDAILSKFRYALNQEILKHL